MTAALFRAGAFRCIGMCLFLCASLSMVMYGTAFCETDELELKGILFTSTDTMKIQSPWGELEGKMLLLNQHQQIKMDGDRLKMIFGLVYFDDKSAMFLDKKIDFSPLWEAKKPMDVKFFQEKDSGKWHVTEGLLGISKDNLVVFEGLRITVIGGASDPVMIAGVPCSETTVMIKGGKPVQLKPGK